jgi:hypothetical protein
MGDPLPKVERRAMELASLALTRALAGNWDGATQAAQRISNECGPIGVQRAMLGWIDTLAGRMGHTPGQRIQIVFQEIETGTIRVPEDEAIRPEVRWAAEMIAARTADDHDAWDALMDEAVGDPVEGGKRFGAVMETCALQLRNLASQKRRPS